jgi:hypothetical protein
VLFVLYPENYLKQFKDYFSKNKEHSIKILFLKMNVIELF